MRHAPFSHEDAARSRVYAPAVRTAGRPRQRRRHVLAPALTAPPIMQEVSPHALFLGSHRRQDDGGDEVPVGRQWHPGATGPPSCFLSNATESSQGLGVDLRIFITGPASIAPGAVSAFRRIRQDGKRAPDFPIRKQSDPGLWEGVTGPKEGTTDGGFRHCYDLWTSIQLAGGTLERSSLPLARWRDCRRG